jgi:hypothetical protein
LLEFPRWTRAEAICCTFFVPDPVMFPICASPAAAASVEIPSTATPSAATFRVKCANCSIGTPICPPSAAMAVSSDVVAGISFAICRKVMASA